MDAFERAAYSKGHKSVCGVDEAGRGPLAGPVVAAAVILARPLPLDLGIRDSKALSRQKRSSLVIDIYRSAVAASVGIVWPEEIDAMNIHRASLKAMELAVEGLTVKPDFLLIDGKFPIRAECGQTPVVSGDALSVSIAAASILAKTARDRIMEAYGHLFPGYNLDGNKGYPTGEHIAAIASLGALPIHRRSFNGVAVVKDALVQAAFDFQGHEAKQL